MPSLLEPKLFDGLSVYQDVVLDGRVVKPGVRDCEDRWRLIEPYFPRAGSVLDVGSNFGWFGLKVCRTFPDCVVASVEADERSAAVQRRVLASHDHRRICLLTGRAAAAQARRFARAGQRFDAVLCLSVLHWLPDHREFLAALAGFSARLFIEQPDPREEGAGIERIRRQIGPFNEYLAAVLPGRPLVRLGQVTAHRTAEYPRELWLVDRPAVWPAEPSPGLEVSALLGCGLSWPPRSWWVGQGIGDRDQNRDQGSGVRGQILFTPAGLSGSLGRIRRRIRGIPERHVLSWRQWLARRVRKAAGAVLFTLRVK